MKTATTTLVLSVASLLTLGIVMLYSSSMADKGTHYLQMQLVWGSLGLIGCVIATTLDYRLLRKLAWPIFGLAVLMLMLVLVPHVGFKINGARRWFKFPGGIRFEPSELGKIALIISVAWYGEHFQRQLGDFKKGFLYPVLMIGLILGLICIEPDRGTTMLMASVCGIMFFTAGARWKFIVPPIVLGIAGFAFSLLYDPMRTKRIFAWLDADKHKMDIGYQANQGILALGAGGWNGLGLGNSREKLGFLPEHNTDFIFAIVGEELGVIATLLVVFAFILLVISGIYIATHSSDTFGMLLGTGITFLIGLQAFINIGVVTSTLPNKGLPLPFISYGGSNLLVMMISVGLLLSIARRGRVAKARSQNPFVGDLQPEPNIS